MTKLRWNCEQRQECYLEERWDCEKVGEAFLAKYKKWPFPYGLSKEGRCSPADLDCVIASGQRRRLPAVLERNGNVIVIENKHVNEPFSEGQRILLEALCRKGITVMVQVCVNNAEDKVIRFDIWRFEDGEIQKDQYLNVDRLRRDEVLHAWWKWANSKHSQVQVAA